MKEKVELILGMIPHMVVMEGMVGMEGMVDTEIMETIKELIMAIMVSTGIMIMETTKNMIIGKTKRKILQFRMKKM